MKYIYHYHAWFRDKTNADQHFDGIVETRTPIDSGDRYREIKRLVGKDAPETYRDSLIIDSLSLLYADKK